MKKVLISLGTFFLTIVVCLFIARGIIGNYGSAVKWICILLAMLIGLGLYLIPTIIAKKRNSPNFTTVLILNIFFGWTLFGWVIALLRALQTHQRVTLFVKNK